MTNQSNSAVLEQKESFLTSKFFLDAFKVIGFLVLVGGIVYNVVANGIR